MLPDDDRAGPPGVPGETGVLGGTGTQVAEAQTDEGTPPRKITLESSAIGDAFPVGEYAMAGLPWIADGWDGTRCPLCDGALVRIPRGADGGEELVHGCAAVDGRCPLTTASWQPGGIAVRHRYDARVSQMHYGAFIQNWTRHYGVIRRLVPTLDIQRFSCLIEYVNALNLWSYAGLRQTDVPYVLLALAEFIRQPAAEGATTWVHFFFDRRLGDVGDLWCPERPEVARFFKVTYSEPTLTPFPTGAQVMRCEVMERDERFLMGDPPQVSWAEGRAFEAFVAMLSARKVREAREVGH
jgi:hypothetical protein